jgi:hypothetical protein
LRGVNPVGRRNADEKKILKLYFSKKNLSKLSQPSLTLFSYRKLRGRREVCIAL